MAQDKRLQKLELTWIGKYDEHEPIEPRILIENPDYSYGTVETGTMPNGKPWNGNMLIHGDNLLALKALEDRAQKRKGKIERPVTESFEKNCHRIFWRVHGLIDCQIKTGCDSEQRGCNQS